MGPKHMHALRALRGLAVIAVLLVFGVVARADAGGSPYGIYVVSADGSDRTQLTSNSWGDTGPAWSPEGTKIAFGRFSPDLRIAQAPDQVAIYGAIYVMNADGGDPHPLTDPASGCSDYQPAWSPDGTTIAFTRDYSNPTSEILAMNADGSGLRNLTNDPGRDDTAPAWSPWLDGHLRHEGRRDRPEAAREQPTLRQYTCLVPGRHVDRLREMERPSGV